MRSIAFLLMLTAAFSSSAVAHSLVGVWRLVEVNAIAMQDSPPRGQINRKEVYTDDGKLLVVMPDQPFAEARTMGSYEVQDTVRVFTTPEGETTATPIQWLDADHFFYEFTPGERWYYARVTGPEARDAQWEPRSVIVVRLSAGEEPTLRDFAYDNTDDRAMPWDKRVIGTWETIRIAGRAVNGPDMPPYGMPNDRYLFGADGVLRKVHANNQADRQDEPVHFKVEGNKLTIEEQFELHFWFNRWGQLVLEQPGVQTTFKRISFETKNVPAGPVIIALLAQDREEPEPGTRIVEVKKSPLGYSGGNAGSGGKTAPVAATPAAKRPAAPKPTFTRPYNGGSNARDLVLADDAASLDAKHAVNRRAKTDGLGAAVRVEDTDLDDKFAVVHSAALKATFEVPLGWHVVDNGARTLVFDADKFVTLALDQRAAPKGPKALLQEILAAQKARQPDVKSQLMDKSEGGALLIVQNWREGEVIGTRSFATIDGSAEHSVIVAEIATQSPADLIRGLNLSEVVLRHVSH